MSSGAQMAGVSGVRSARMGPLRCRSAAAAAAVQPRPRRSAAFVLQRPGRNGRNTGFNYQPTWCAGSRRRNVLLKLAAWLGRPFICLAGYSAASRGRPVPPPLPSFFLALIEAHSVLVGACLSLPSPQLTFLALTLADGSVPLPSRLGRKAARCFRLRADAPGCRPSSPRDRTANLSAR